MNCKPGDLAYVVRADRSENIGRVVSVVRHFGGFSIDGLFCDWVVEGDVVPVDPAVTIMVCPDAWLRPISGVPVHDEQHDEQPTAA